MNDSVFMSKEKKNRNTQHDFIIVQWLMPQREEDFAVSEISYHWEKIRLLIQLGECSLMEYKSTVSKLVNIYLA